MSQNLDSSVIRAALHTIEILYLISLLVVEDCGLDTVAETPATQRTKSQGQSTLHIWRILMFSSVRLLTYTIITSESYVIQ